VTREEKLLQFVQLEVAAKSLHGRLAVRPGQKQGHLRSSSESLFSSPRQCRRFETTDAAARILGKTRATQIGRDRPRQTVIVQSGVYISVIRGRNGRIKRL